MLSTKRACIAVLAMLLTLAACGGGSGSSDGGSGSAGGSGSNAGAAQRDATADGSIDACYGEGELDEFGTSRAGYGADVAVTNSGDDTADYVVTVVFEKGERQLASMDAELLGVAPGDTATTNVTPVEYMTTFTCRITSVERTGSGAAGSEDESGGGSDDASACETERSTVATALEAYNASHGSYPNGMDDVVGQFLKSAPRYWTFTGTIGEDGFPVLEPIGDLPEGCDS